jgi:formate/nitrite transporter FocA (FNT family)
LPVFAFAVLIALSAKFVAVASKRLTPLKLWARSITGSVFVGIGIYFAGLILLPDARKRAEKQKFCVTAGTQLDFIPVTNQNAGKLKRGIFT